jgi:hypothetical protein
MLFAQKLQMVDTFPLFFTLPQEMPPSQAMQMGADMHGALQQQASANGGGQDNQGSGGQMASMNAEPAPQQDENQQPQ